MDNLATVHVLESHADLNEPVEDFRLRELPLLLLLPLNVIGQVTDIAVLHDDD